MSMTIHVFARKDETFIELLWNGSGSVMYEVLNRYAPYGKIALLGKRQIEEAIISCARCVRLDEDEIQHSQKLLAQIKEWNNPVDEKIVAIHDEEQLIAEYADSVKHYKETSVILEFLENVSAELYVGIECGDGVGVQDIVSSIT